MHYTAAPHEQYGILGMMKRICPEHHITNYVDVKSVDEYPSKIESLGDKIMVPKTPMPEA
jgi:uncharacterized protein